MHVAEIKFIDGSSRVIENESAEDLKAEVEAAKAEKMQEGIKAARVHSECKIPEVFKITIHYDDDTTEEKTADSLREAKEIILTAKTSGNVVKIVDNFDEAMQELQAD